MSILRLNHVQITVPPGAEAEARAFYCGVLGLKEVEKPDALKSRGGLWLQVGDQQVHIGTEDGVDRERTKAHIAYQVEDIDHWRQVMTAHNIPIGDSVPIPGYARFEIRDPFGNRVELIADMRLAEQVAYYRARASEYDEWFYRVGRYDHGEAANRQWFSEAQQVMDTLQGLGPLGHVLELAAGTGIWTEQLLKISQQITALDAAPEVLAINRGKLNSERVTYEQADLFTWEPAVAYDAVFFGFWLSHVPPDRLDAFLDKVRRATRPGGRLFLVDSQRAPGSSAHDHTPYTAESIEHVRKLNDGREFTIYKIFYTPDDLRERLARHGFEADVRRTDSYFIYASAVRRKE